MILLKTIVKSILNIIILLAIVLGPLLLYMMWMPSPDYILDNKNNSEETKLLEEVLRQHVNELTIKEVGRNHISEDNITPAKDYISGRLKDIGLEPKYQTYVHYGNEYTNIIVDIPGTTNTSEILVVGAHYDSVEGTPGANDNASGVGALIEIAKYISKNPVARGVRFIAFANEEPPYFQTEEMGSLVYVNTLKNSKENIIGMISIETIGYFTNEPNSQMYPRLFDIFYPSTGNFITFIGNLESRALVSKSISLFRENSLVPSEGISSPEFIPGISWSDHWSFWVHGYKAIMVTDTAPFRYEHYHKSTDTPDKLNYKQYARSVYGLMRVVEGIANTGV